MKILTTQMAKMRALVANAPRSVSSTSGGVTLRINLKQNADAAAAGNTSQELADLLASAEINDGLAENIKQKIEELKNHSDDEEIITALNAAVEASSDDMKRYLNNNGITENNRFTSV